MRTKTSDAPTGSSGTILFTEKYERFAIVFLFSDQSYNSDKNFVWQMVLITLLFFIQFFSIDFSLVPIVIGLHFRDSGKSAVEGENLLLATE